MSRHFYSNALKSVGRFLPQTQVLPQAQALPQAEAALPGGATWKPNGGKDEDDTDTRLVDDTPIPESPTTGTPQRKRRTATPFGRLDGDTSSGMRQGLREEDSGRSRHSDVNV